MGMDEGAVVEAIRAYAGVQFEVAKDNHFFFVGEDRRLPFATIMTNDENDGASRLDRFRVYRLNLGVRPGTYRALFGPPPAARRDGGVLDSGHDYTRLDTLMPHPVYAPQGWVCVLNPSRTTFSDLRPLLDEAYGLAWERHMQYRIRFSGR